MKQWRIENKNIKDLKDHPKNARQISKEDFGQLKESIEKFGCIDKPITDGNNMIIGGHQRLKVLKKLKIKQIDCWVPDEPLTEEEVDELNIRMNRNHGDFDFDVLANEWDVLNLVEWGFDASEFEIDLLGDEKEKKSKKKEEKECPHCGLKI